MAKEEAQNDEITKEQDSNAETAVGKDGNFLGGYGKIFLVVAILMVQAGAAYAVLNTYYNDIAGMLEGLESDDTVYHIFENIIINPAESGGERYLIVSLAVEVNSTSEVELLDKYSAEIIDKVNLILGRYSARQLSDLSIRDDIKQQIGIMINESINKKAVRNLFFTKYVLQ